MPLVPFWMCNSTRLSKLCQSTLPFLNGVTSATMEPKNICCLLHQNLLEMGAEFGLEGLYIFAERGGEMVAARSRIAKPCKIIEHDRKAFPFDQKIDRKKSLTVNRLSAKLLLGCGPLGFGGQAIQGRQSSLLSPRASSGILAAVGEAFKTQAVNDPVRGPFGKPFHKPVMRRFTNPVGERKFRQVNHFMRYGPHAVRPGKLGEPLAVRQYFSA